MKNFILKITLGISIAFAGLSANAQCPAIICPGNITVNNNAGDCDSIVTYTNPTALDTCSTTPMSQTFNYTGTIVNFTVPAGVTQITVDAYGAQGGGGTNNGGRGARMQGDLTVTPGQQIQILVGEMGKKDYGYGGGGGSFVMDIANNPLIVAGGGGGAEHSDNMPGYDAVITTNGMTIQGAAGGTAGSGGDEGTPNTSGCGWSGSGGAGYLGNGGVSNAGGGFSFVNGGSGGTDFSANCVVAGDGGFGGGGSGGNAGGGGGGYSGGAGGANIGIVPDRGGGGGGSFNSGTNQTNTAGVQTGNGQIIISYDAPTPLATNQIAGLSSGSAFPVGTTVNTFYATDGANNNDTCSFTVTVVDVENPTITCPGPVTINTDAGQCTSTASIGTATGTDNCAAPTITNDAPASFPIGNTTVTWTSTDAATNSVTCTQVVTVVDAENPIITCPANITSCDSVVTYSTPVGSDNCSGVTTAMSAGLASGSTFPVGVTTITYVVTDAANNQDSCSFTVEVFAPLTGIVTDTICSNDSIIVNGTAYNAGNPSGIEVFSNIGPNGCDSNVTVNLEFNSLPFIQINPFNQDTICETDGLVNLPAVNPTGGAYSGNGVSGNMFDPTIAGVGTHFVVYTFTDSNTCSSMDSSMIVVNSCVGVDENGVLAGVNIYPNPTNNILNITLGNIPSDVNLTLTSIEGKVVYQENNVSNNKVSVDISNNSKGIYFLKVEVNNQYKVYKVIKE